MRLRLAVLSTMVSLCLVAQRGGGTPMGRTTGGGRWGSSSPIPPRFRGIGRNRWWGGQPSVGQYVTAWPFPTWFDTPLCASPLFPLAPSCSFGDTAGSTYYPPPPLNPGPSVNVTVIPAPQSSPSPAQSTSVPGASDPSNSLPDASLNTYPTNSAEISQAGSADFQARSGCSSPVQDKLPPLIILKTGAYSVNKYWVKNKTLYFETTSGDTLYAPLSLLERILPAR